MGLSFLIRITFAFFKPYDETRWGYLSSFGFPLLFVSLSGIIGGAILRHSDFLRVF